MTSFKIIPNTTQSTEVKVVSNAESANISVTGFGGPKGSKGDQGIQGEQGPSGILSVESPIINSGTETEAVIGIDQTLLEIEQSQVVDLVVDLASKETPSGAQAKADTAKSEAISTSSLDATTKANTAESNAKAYSDLTFEPKTSQRFVPSGGTTGQILSKNTNTNYDTGWIDNYTSEVKHLVKNDGTALTKGTPVYVSNSTGTNMIVSAASNTSEPTSSKTMGLLAQDLAINATGFVITEGLLSGINTSSASAGDPVWLGSNGSLIYGLTNKPAAPLHMVFIGVVTRVNSQNGEIFVKVQNGFELEELHNLVLTSVATGDVIVKDSNGTWKNQSPYVAGDSRYLKLSGGSLTGSLSITGDLSVSGTTTTTNSDTLNVSDPMIYMGGDNPSNVLDLGIVASFNNGTYQHTGLVRDASDNKWKLFSNVVPEPTTTVDFTSAIYDTLKLGNLEATSLSGSLSNVLTIGDGLSGSSYDNSSAKTITVDSTVIRTAADQIFTGFNTFNNSTGIKVSQGLAVFNNNGVSTTGTFISATTGRAQFVTNSSTNIPLTVVGANGQSASLLELQNSSGTKQLGISSVGWITGGGTYNSSTTTSQFDLNGNITANYIASLQGLIARANTATNIPMTVKGAASQTANLLEWQDSTGAQLGYILSSGSIYTSGRLIVGSDLSAKIQSTASTSTQIPLILRGAVSQSANIQEWQDSTGAVMSRVANNGYIYSGVFNASSNFYSGNQIIGGRAYFTFDGTAAMGMANWNTSLFTLGLRNTANQLADSVQIQSSSGSILGGRNAVGQIYTGSTSPVKGTTQFNISAASASSATVATFTSSLVSNGNPVAIGQLITTTGFTSETYFNGTFVVTAIGGSSGAWTFTVVGSGFTVGSATILGTFQLPVQTSVTPSSPATVGIAVRAGSNQYADLQQWQNSSGSTITSISNAGAFITNVSMASYGTITAWATSGIGFIARVGTAITTDLMQYQTNSTSIMGGRNSLAQIYTGSTSTIATSVGGATTAASGTGTVATITTTSATNASVGDMITVSGVTPTGYNGTYIVTAVSNTTPFTISYSNSTTGSQTVAGTVSLPAQTSISSRSSGTIPLIVRGASGQISDLQRWQDSSGNNKAYIASNGYFNTSGSAAITGSLLVYGGSTITAPGSGSPALIAKGVASQTANLQEWQDSNGNVTARISNIGQFITSTEVYANNYQNNSGNFTLSNGGQISLLNTQPASIVEKIRGAVSQTANLTEWQDSSGNILAYVGSAGVLKSVASVYTPLLQSANGSNNAYISMTGNTVKVTGASGNVPLTIQGAASQTANLFEIQDSTPSTLLSIAANGRLYATWGITTSSSIILGNGGVRTDTENIYTYLVTPNAGTPTVPVMVVRPRSGQTTDLQVWQSSGSSTLAKVDQYGGFYGAGLGPVNQTGGYISTANSTAVQIITNSAAKQALIVKGATSQTANIQEWQNSSGAVVASIDASGNLSAANFASQVNYIPTYIQNTAPTSAPAKYMWWDTTGGSLTLWIEDGT